MTVVRKLFEFADLVATPPMIFWESPRRSSAQADLRRPRLLDSAELLPANEAAALRKHLSQVYPTARQHTLSLAFVVASRREDR